MNSSFYNGISGIKTSQFTMDVWSDNIANSSTVGFKGNTPEVSTLFSTALNNAFSTTSNDQGLGSQAQTTALNLTQGVLENADNTFDLAIDGEGWFAVKGENNQTYYTRAGAFSIDASGSLVDENGNYLLATSGNNITATTLDDATLAKFGTYYTGTSTTTKATPYAISGMDDVPLGSVGQQTKVTLPDVLYYPPVATSNVSYGANLNPAVTIDAVTLDLNSADYPSSVTPSSTKTVTLNGTVSNTPTIQNGQKDDLITVTLTDTNGKKLSINTKLDDNLAWSISDYDISSLDTTTDLQVTATIQTEQEVANTSHYSTAIIGPDGDKDILDMTFTKSVPQQTSGSTWNADIKILSYYEDYKIEQYDATKTYDTSVYNVDTKKGTVTKIYDPALYSIDTTTNKVYQIVDTQTGVVTFGGNGELLSNSIPTLSNGGTTLNLNLGTINGFDGLIASTSIEKTNSVKTDGSAEGFLTDYGIDTNGNIVAEFSNGKSSAIAKVAIYHFQNDQGLSQLSSTYFQSSSNSGQPIFYTDSSGKSFLNSKILSKTLEGSNINMATALTELIVIQKAFDASSKSITTSDELIKNAINMKT